MSPYVPDPDHLVTMLRRLDQRIQVLENSNQFLGGLVVGGPLSATSITVTGSSIGAGGTAITQLAVYSVNLTPPAMMASVGFQEQTFGLSGLLASDKLLVNAPAPATNVALVAARASDVNVLALTFLNLTAASNVPAAGVYTIVAIRS